MKILLTAVNAKYIHSCPAVYSLRASCGQPELVEIAEFTINDRYQDILSGILDREADLIGFSTYIWNTDIIRDLAADIRRLLRGNIILFAGGPEASYAPEKFLESCDFVICREGEIPFRYITEYAAGMEKDTPKSMLINHIRANVPGAAYLRRSAFCASACDLYSNHAERIINLPPHETETDGDVIINSPHHETETDGDVIINPPHHETETDGDVRTNPPHHEAKTDGDVIINPFHHETETDIDEIPFLYNDLSVFDNRILYYESSRGCPFNCTYCLSSIEKALRFRKIDTVLRELQYFLDREVPQVKFIDRTFNCSHERTFIIWKYLRDHDNGKTNFHFEIGADLLNEDEISLLNTLRPGLVQLEIGIQSTYPETLKAIRRITDLKKLYTNINRIRSGQNINLHVDLIAGLPYEGFERFAESFNDVYALHANQLQLGFLKVLNGTVMHEMAEEYDIRYSRRSPYEVLSTKWISYAELNLLRRICDVLEYYYNSQQFVHTLEYLEKYWESAFGFFRKLAEFFRKHGYDRERPAAARRYEVLEEFVKECGLFKNTDDEETVYRIFQEYLRFDRSLHIHKNRRHSVSDVYDFGNGKVLITIDYECRNVLNGEAAYTVAPAKNIM